MHAVELLILWIALFSRVGHTTKFVFQRQTLPSFSTKEMFEVYALHSIPVDVLTLSRRSFSLPTTAIAFRSEYSMQPIVLQYLAKNKSASVWPLINENKAVWDTEMEVYATIGPADSAQWSTSSLLGRISGVTFNRYLDWLEEFQSINHAFVFHTFASYSSVFLASYTWNDFLVKSMDILAAFSVPMQPLLPVSYTDVVVRIHDNVTAVHNGDNASMIWYYSHMINCLEDILTDDYGEAVSYCMTRTSLQHVYYCDNSNCFRASAYQVSVKYEEFAIPSPKAPPLEAINVLDYMIAMLIVLLMLLGCGCAMLKLEIIQNHELYRRVCNTLAILGLDCFDRSSHDSATIESCELVSSYCSNHENMLEDT